jgi:hypothetical protein
LRERVYSDVLEPVFTKVELLRGGYGRGRSSATQELREEGKE